MKKALLISIHPEWAEKILNGKKTIEIRKSMPKCELPIDVYLYCTKGKSLLRLPTGNKEWFIDVPFGWVVDKKSNFNGKVVAKFTLNYVSTCLNTDYGNEEILKNACLTKQELDDYVGKRKFFAWHIDNLEIFDKPKELSEFGLTKAPQKCVWVYGGEQS